MDELELDTGATVPAVIALPADLLFGARIRGAAAAARVPVVVAATAAEVRSRARAAPARLILLDLDSRREDVLGLIRALKSDPATAGAVVLGFVSHVNAGAIAAAREAGADRVLARSAFVRDLPALLRSAG